MCEGVRVNKNFSFNTICNIQILKTIWDCYNNFNKHLTHLTQQLRQSVVLRLEVNVKL